MPDFVWLVLGLIWLISAILELLAAVTPAVFSRVFAFSSLLALTISCGVFLGIGFNFLAVVFIVLTFYRVVLICRLLGRRLTEAHLRRISLRDSAILLPAQLAVIFVSFYWPDAFTFGVWMAAFAGAQLAVALIFLLSFIKQVKLTQWQPPKATLSDSELPTLTVAIPAKNETYELEKCLDSLVASDYPKLEVLVLDDAAGNKTGEIINALAHDGVRFILGEKPGGNWLAKNLAYDRLAREANGEYILFCGVDVRFSVHSLRQIVTNILEQQQEMFSFMPVNNQRSLLVQPMRYFWELARPRLGASHPVLSTCWLIKKAKLKSLGGLAAVKNEIVPERYFAGSCSKNGLYRFYRSNDRLGITSEKPSGRQRSTAVRTRYPLLHKRLGSVAGTGLFSLVFLVGPLALAIGIPLSAWTAVGEACALIAIIIWLAIYGKLLGDSFNRNALAASPAFFLAALFDVWLVNYSLLKYEFGRVVWRGRDVAARQTAKVSGLS